MHFDTRLVGALLPLHFEKQAEPHCTSPMTPFMLLTGTAAGRRPAAGGSGDADGADADARRAARRGEATELSELAERSGS